MSSTGKIVISYEADPPPIYYSPELEAIEERIQSLLGTYAAAGSGTAVLQTENRPQGLLQRGNNFILTTGFGRMSFDFLIESLIEASEGAWLLVYGGLDGEGSIMLELQDGRVVTRRERVPVDTLNDYSEEDEGPWDSADSASETPPGEATGSRVDDGSEQPEDDDDLPY